MKKVSIDQASLPVFHYRIAKLTPLNFSFHKVVDDFKDDNCSWIFALAIKTSKPRKQVALDFTVRFTEKIEDTEFDYMSAEIELIFDIQEYDQLPRQEGKIFLPEVLLYPLTAITISTMRGFIAGRGAGTVADFAVMPVLSPQQLLADSSLNVDEEQATVAPAEPK